jgi:translation initiation factor 3 subunit A
LSEVYSSIKISHLLSLVAPLNVVVSEEKPSDESSAALPIEKWDKEKLETFIMSAARHGELLVRVDHAQGTITFTQSVFTSTSSATVQPSPSSLVVSRISSLAHTLHNTLQTIHPPSQPSQEDRLQALVVAAQAERKAILVRQLIVGRRRELLSEISVRKEKEEASRKAEQARREKEEDAKRAVQDVRRRELERVKQTVENQRAEEARRLAQTLKGTLKGPVEVCARFTGSAIEINMIVFAGDRYFGPRCSYPNASRSS